MQSVLGYDSFRTGETLLPCTAAILSSSVLIRWVASKSLVQIALALTVVGLFVLVRHGESGDDADAHHSTGRLRVGRRVRCSDQPGNQSEALKGETIMSSFVARSFVAALMACSVTVLDAAGQTQPREPHTFLMKHIGFKPAELGEMEQGRVITKVLKTNVDTEVAVFGVVWIDAPMDWFVRWQKDIETLESGDAVQAIKKISDPPQLSDFDNLTFPEDDLEAIPECKVGNCEVKADAPALERLQKEVNWSAADAHEQASRLIRQMMLEAAQEYRKNGDAALGAYRDKKRPTFLGKEFDGLLENSPFLVEYIPEFHRYLDEYPNADLPGADSYLYWSRVQFGLRPTVRLNHVVIYPFGEGDDAAVAIGSKMLYASHYFHTALELKFLVKDSAKPEAEGFYLISLNRSRSDGLTGLFGGIVRSAAQSEARKGLAFALESGKQVLEEAYTKRSSQ